MWCFSIYCDVVCISTGICIWVDWWILHGAFALADCVLCTAPQLSRICPTLKEADKMFVLFFGDVRKQKQKWQHNFQSYCEERIQNVHLFFAGFHKIYLLSLFLICWVRVGLKICALRDSKPVLRICWDTLLMFQPLKRCVECLRNCCLPNFPVYYKLEEDRFVVGWNVCESEALRLENRIVGSFVWKCI